MPNAVDYVRYANQGATRNLPLDPRLIDAFKFLPEMGLAMEVFSGGQPAAGSGLARIGSTRHDHGNAADVFFVRNGQRLDWSNPEHLPTFGDIISRAKAAGVTGFGAGPGYMQPGSMHVGFGTPGVWGAGGKSANAPAWLRAAYEGAPLPAQTNVPAASNAMPAAPIAAGGAQQRTAAFGDLVAPRAPVAAPNFGNVIQAWAERRAAEEQSAAADQARKAALAHLFA